TARRRPACRLAVEALEGRVVPTVSFGPPIQYQTAAYDAADVVSADFNRDGKLDLAVPNSGTYSVAVLLGNGTGTFAAPGTYDAGGSSLSMAAGDFDGDGNLDLAVVNNQAPGSVLVLAGNGDGTFAAPVTYAVGTYPYRVAAGDFDGDGRSDLAVVGQVGDARAVSILLARPPGGCQAPPAYVAG